MLAKNRKMWYNWGMYDEMPFSRMTAINQFVVNEREKKLGILALDTDIFRGQVGEEKQNRDDYAGREILELIQNADDAMYEGGLKDDKIKIVLRGDELSFYNDGAPFDEKGVKSLLVPHNSSKGGELIGNKGLGFRALLNEAEYIYIESMGLSVRFGREDNQEYFEKYNKHNLPGQPPILNTPRVVEPQGTDGYITMVRMKLKNEHAVERLRLLVNEVDEKTLLFLQKGTEIMVVTDAGERTYTKKMAGIIYTVSTTVNGEVVAEHQYKMMQKNYQLKVENADGVVEERKAKIALAWTKDEQEDYRTLYSYLKTKIQFPTNFLVHANFDLTANRADIVENEYNWSLTTGIVDAMFECAKLATSTPGRWDACDYVMGNYEKFDDDIRYDGMTVRQYFMEKLRSAKILPTTNGKYVSFADEPKHYRARLADYLKGDGFEALLKYADDVKYDEFVEKYGAGEYGLEFLKQKIDEVAVGLTMSEVVTLSIEFYNEFGNRNVTWNEGNMPKFFRGKKHDLIPAEYAKFTEPTREVFRGLPRFLRFDFVQDAMLKEAMEQLEIESVEKLTQSNYGAFYGIRQYRLETVARQYYNELMERDDDAEEWASFVRWCFVNGLTERRTLEEYRISKMYLPARADGIVAADEAYLTGDYGCELVEKIWPEEEGLICDYAFFGLDEAEKAAFTRFLKELLVADKPRLNVDGSIDGLAEILKRASVEVLNELLLDMDLDLWNSDVARKVILNTAWIPVDEERFAPGRVILDRAYRRNYEGIVGLSRERLADILGVRLAEKLATEEMLKTEITQFDADTIYGVMLGLPEKDPKGVLARRVQGQMAKMVVAEVEEKLAVFDVFNYDKFLKDGQVFCRDGQYHPASESFYMADGVMPEATYRGRNLIEAPRKQGAAKIERLFGVAKLTVDYKVSGFVRSAMDERFLREWGEIKTGVMATVPYSAEKMRVLKVVLCDEVKILVDGEVRALSAFDFAMGGRGEYYLMVPDEGWDEMRYDSDFVEAMANIIIARVGTDAVEEARSDIKVVLLTRNIRKEFLRDVEKHEAWERAVSELASGEADAEMDAERVVNGNFEKVKSAVVHLDKQYRMSLYDYLSREGEKPEGLRPEDYSRLVRDFSEWIPDRDDAALLQRDFDAQEYVVSRKFEGMDAEVVNDCGQAKFREFWETLDEEGRMVVNGDAQLKDLVRFGYFEKVRAEILEREKTEEVDAETLDGEADDEGSELRAENEIDVSQLRAKTKRGYGGGGFGGGGAFVRGSDEQKKKNGIKGQKLAIKLLRGEGFEVEDRTGDALLSGENVDGDDTTGYDLEYTADGVKHCIEVKACTAPREARFTISRGEYETAERLSQIEGVEYEIFCVMGVRKKRPNWVRIPWEDVKKDLVADGYRYSKIFEAGVSGG